MKMAELRSALEDSGLGGTATLQVAGNIIFDPGRRSTEACTTLIRDTVRKRFGHDLPVIIRSHRQLVDAERRNPFIGSQEGRWVMTVFLDRTPDPGTALDPAAGAPGSFAVDGCEVFIRYPSGVAGSKLQPAWFEKQLGVVGTARNANTVARIIRLTL
jgi:uncharacterized protein (DUF1697 family)